MQSQQKPSANPSSTLGFLDLFLNPHSAYMAFSSPEFAELNAVNHFFTNFLVFLKEVYFYGYDTSSKKTLLNQIDNILISPDTIAKINLLKQNKLNFINDKLRDTASNPGTTTSTITTTTSTKKAKILLNQTDYLQAAFDLKNHFPYKEQLLHNLANAVRIGGVATYGKGSAEELLLRISDHFFNMLFDSVTDDNDIKDVFIFLLETLKNLIEKNTLFTKESFQQYSAKMVSLIHRLEGKSYLISLDHPQDHPHCHTTTLLRESRKRGFAARNIQETFNDIINDKFVALDKNTLQIISVTDKAAIDLRPIIGNRDKVTTNLLFDEKKFKQITLAIMQQIIDEAINNNIEVIHLSAMGCGAFQNDATVIANCFADIFEKNSDQLAGKIIHFGILPDNDNYNKFFRVFAKRFFQHAAFDFSYYNGKNLAVSLTSRGKLNVKEIGLYDGLNEENNNTVRISAPNGDIMSTSCDAIAVASNRELNDSTLNRWGQGNSVFAHVLKCAESDKKFYETWQDLAKQKYHLLQPGNIVVLPKAKSHHHLRHSVMLAVTPDVIIRPENSETALQMLTTYINVLRRANELNYQTLALTALGTKAFNWNLEQAIEICAFAVRLYLQYEPNNALKNIMLVVKETDQKLDKSANDLFCDFFQSTEVPSAFSGKNLLDIAKHIEEIYSTNVTLVCLDFDNCLTKENTGKGIGEFLLLIPQNLAKKHAAENLKPHVKETLATLLDNPTCRLAIVSFNYSSEVIQLHLSSVLRDDQVKRIMVKHRDSRFGSAPQNKNAFILDVAKKVEADGYHVEKIRFYDDLKKTVADFNNHFKDISDIPHEGIVVGTKENEPNYTSFLVDLQHEFGLETQATLQSVSPSH